MAKPKHDYDSPDFYKLIEQLAMNGYTDDEIANELDLTREVFGCMKNGNYDGWNEEDNKRRGERISNVLAHGRTKINALVRSAYLKAAFGGKKLKSKNVTRRKMKIDGAYTKDEEIMTTDGETELPPNIQALTTWMYHHDPEWRKVERKQDEDKGDNRIEGFDVTVVYNKKEDLDLQERKKDAPTP